MSIVLCPDCECGCVPVDISCIRKNTRIKDLTLASHPRLFDLSNAFIARQVLGETCMNMMCHAIKIAANAASDAEEADKWQEYLSEPWKTITKSQYFIRAYYLAVLAYYDMSGDSVSQLTADGRVTHKRPLQEGGKENVFLKEAVYMATVNGYQLNLAVMNVRSRLLYPFYTAGKLPCYNDCGNAALLGCGDQGGKFWHS